ncbi:cinnamoyl-CoA reductase 2-like isoform X2 [Punica granatum]|uniref:Cinnamoyl-CoA reductase 2-like isoform X2 n=1 Tax=Punica granatum TaxID=22663 RepID=A0A6P8EKK1_PUNGR|nr:cinnamoyl-CoA reductase 2-like isoform X2 [Punica granatum]
MAMAMAMAMAMEVERKRVCVTGAGGFVASWVVKLLLSKGYVVHGTVRDPKDEKYAHLSKLDRASDNLKIFKADLLDYDSLRTAIAGCAGVLHVASPVPSSSVPNPEVEVLEPAVKGTLNVLKACKEVKIRRVVYVSSTAAVVMNPNWPKDQVMDESCWSSKEYCKATENWYCLSKTEAESAAFEYAKQNGLDVVAVCPGLIFGPVLQLTLNSSTLVLVKLVQGGEDSVPNRLRPLVDVRDVAEAVIMAYEKPEAEGRYICVAHAIKTRDLAEKLRRLYPDFTYPKNYSETQHDNKLNSEKLQKLGWTYRPLEETLIDSIESYREAGLLK